MEVKWIWLVFNVVITQLQAAPLNQNESSKGSTSNSTRCSFEQYIKTGGTCDLTAYDRVRVLCKEIQKAMAKDLGRDDIEDAVDDGITCFGDYMLTEAQAHDLLDNSEEGSSQRRVKRKIRSDFQTNKWPNLIYYRIDPDLNSKAVRAILDGIKLWESVTCVKFERVYDENFETQHLIFVDAESMFSGCSSYIGRVTSFREQPIYLSSVCFDKAIVAHEIAHAMGFIHEHQRPDRDSYVTVQTHNIRRGYEGYFATFKPSVVTSLTIEYDYSSVMHYYGTAFGYSNRNTIETKDPRYQKTIGQRVEVSFLDAKLINMAYCPDTCSNFVQLQCQNHGYQDPHDCNNCRCPDGWEGKLCENIALPKNAVCGGILTATTEEKYIESPGYNTQQELYQIGQECTWLIQVTQGAHIKLEFADDFYLFDEIDTCYHWVEIRSETSNEDGNTQLLTTGPRYCGRSRPTGSIISSGNQVMVLFRARFMQTIRGEMRGFKLKYSSDGDFCSSVTCHNHGICHSSSDGFRCECKHGFTGETCDTYDYKSSDDLDLVIMLDSTYHSYKDFYYFKELSEKLLLYINNEDISVHRGIMTFHRTPTAHAKLGQYSSLSSLDTIISSLYTNYGGTDIFSAFQLLFTEYYNSMQGDRQQEANVAIMIVDSHHTYWYSQEMITNVKSKLRVTCTEVIAIDIGNRADRGLLETLLGRNNVLHQKNYTVLLEPSVIDTVINAVISAVQRSKHCIINKTSTTTKSSSSTITTTTTTTSITTTTPKITTTSTSTTASSTPSTTAPTTTTTEASTTTSIKASSTTTTSTTKATTTTATTKQTTTSAATTTTVPSGHCWHEKAECDQKCGGCGYMNVTQFCMVNGQKTKMDHYREPCEASPPCERDCSVWIGKYYKRMCKICCPEYIISGDVCIQDHPEYSATENTPADE